MTRINTRKAAYLEAADACRHAAQQGWQPEDGALIYGSHHPGDWACCALGAVALKRRTSPDMCETAFAEAINTVADMRMEDVLDGGDEADAISVAYVFDHLLATWDRCVKGIPLDAQDGYQLMEVNKTRASMARLTPEQFWLLAAKRFEQLAN